jgi:hypothetical protein
MNKYTQALAVKRLHMATAFINSLSASGAYAKSMSVSEFVHLKMAIDMAAELLEEDLLSRIKD